MRVQLNTGLGRLTTTMSNFRLAEMDMTDSTFNIDFVSDAQPSDEIKCETDFEMQLKMSGAKTVFVFD